MAINKLKCVEKGELIFAEGEVGNCAFIIQQGRVQILTNSNTEKIVLAHLGDGEIFGEMAVIDASPRSATAIALEATELIEISAEQISERIQSSDPIVRFLLSVLLKRMRSTNESTRNIADSGVESTKRLTDFIEPAELNKQKERVIKKMKIESELKSALVSQDFELNYQPILDLENNRIAGFEALIRWNHPEQGMIRPDLFIGIAEETSLIVPIGKWCIETAVKDLVYFKDFLDASGFPSDIFMSINISGRQFNDLSFLSHLHNVLDKNSISPGEIKLEVTERVFLDDTPALQVLKMCRDLGYIVALDDFGTGYSSLSCLNQLPVDNLKVDQSFVKRLRFDKKTLTITRSIVEMANGLEMEVIAEGIEEVEDLILLKKMNCRYGQGYLFGRPVSLTEAVKYFSKFQGELSAAG